MHYSMEDAAVQALLANLTVAIESGGGTKQSVVLKGLNHRYASVLAYVICARRDQRKRIVEMDNVRLFLAEYRSQIVNAVAGPGRSQPKFRFGEQIVLANFIVPAGELQDTVSGLDQHCFFRQELGVFARYNAQFLKLAADTVAGFSPELAHELRRNYLEEGGERGKVPAHYILYTNALLADLGLLVNGHVPAAETVTLVVLHQVLVNSHMPSVIAGGYYATEGVAIAETEILRDITNRYGQLTSGTSGKDLKALTYYYDLHLDEDHEAAQVGGLSVEAAHIEGLAQFIRKSELYGLDLPQATEGFLQIFNGMTHWWTQLAYRARDLN